VISRDISKEAHFRYPSFLIEHDVKAVANVLIIGTSGKRPFGILQIDSRQPHLFNDKDTAFLRSYANLLAAAVDRLRTMEEARDGQERLRLTLDASRLGSWELDLASDVMTHSPLCKLLWQHVGRRNDPHMPAADHRNQLDAMSGRQPLNNRQKEIRNPPKAPIGAARL
jgi:transcriptional regulator with GAF, ATPase, and Fis domain